MSHCTHTSGPLFDVVASRQEGWMCHACCMLYAWHMFKYLYYHSCSLGATMWMAVSGLCCEQEVTAGSTPRSMYCGLTASHCGAAVVIRREWTRMVAWSAQFKYYSNWSVNQFRLHLMSSDSHLVRSFVCLAVCFSPSQLVTGKLVLSLALSKALAGLRKVVWSGQVRNGRRTAN